MVMRIPQEKERCEGGIADEHVVVEESGAEEGGRCEGVEQADDGCVCGGDAEGLEARAEEGSGTGCYGGHDKGGGKKGDEQKVELEVFLDGSPEEFAIIWGDGWSGLLEIPGFDLSDEWAEDKERDGTGDGGAGVVVDECTVGGGEDVIGVAEEALDVEGAGVGEGDGGEMLAHDVGRPEERVGDPAGEEHPPRCAHGGIIAWGNERSNPATYDGGSWDGSGVFA